MRMQSIIHFYHLSRPKNVWITLVAFCLSALIANGKSFDFLIDWRFGVAAACLMMITATGYWVNDVFDFKIDRVNKPKKVIVNAHLSVKKVLTVYFVVLALCFAACFLFLNMALTAINAGAAILLFAYAGLLKRTTMIGNLLIAALTALVVYEAMVLYEPRIALGWAALFAFEINFIREVVKDIEDIEGDLRFKLQTLPIRIGLKGAKGVVAFAYIIFILSCPLPFIEEYLRIGVLNWAYILCSAIGIILPSLRLLWDLRYCNEKEDFTKQSKALKWLMLSGMLSLLFLQ